METEIKTGSIDWQQFRQNLGNQQFKDVYEMVDIWEDIDSIKLVVMILCEALMRLKEAEK